MTKSFFVEYLDYLEMQQKFYGKVKEKYPTHFKTEHDIMALKVNQARLLAKCEDFEQQNESIKDLAYSGSGYCIVVPTKPEELAEEGINLSHCVGQYIDRVAGGDCHILFLRRPGRSGSVVGNAAVERKTDLPGAGIQPAADHGPGTQVPGAVGQGEGYSDCGVGKLHAGRHKCACGRPACGNLTSYTNIDNYYK